MQPLKEIKELLNSLSDEQLEGYGEFNIISPERVKITNMCNDIISGKGNYTFLRPEIQAGDTVEMLSNLSKDIRKIKMPRLGEVKNVNGAYILVKPLERDYLIDFLENEVKLYQNK